jgi:hypothetical protein
VQYFSLSALGGGGIGVTGPLFSLKFDPVAMVLFLDGVLKALKPPPSISTGTSLNRGSPECILLIFLKDVFVS